jgi:hypothetical protein
MTTQTLVIATSCLAYVGVLVALGVLALLQGNHDAVVALTALASPGAVGAGLAVNVQRAIAAEKAEVTATQA